MAIGSTNCSFRGEIVVVIFAVVIIIREKPFLLQNTNIAEGMPQEQQFLHEQLSEQQLLQQQQFYQQLSQQQPLFQQQQKLLQSKYQAS